MTGFGNQDDSDFGIVETFENVRAKDNPPQQKSIHLCSVVYITVKVGLCIIFPILLIFSPQTQKTGGGWLRG